MNNEQITNKENGRSMVEMLGVLAVVGVLSIGALAGYVYGMDKYRANEVLNSVSQMAIIGTQQRALNPTVTIDLHEFNNKTVYPFEVVTEGVEEGQFAIQFSGIPEGTCKRLLSASKEFVAAADIDVNGVQIDTADVSCTDGDTNAFVYYFDNAMTGDETGGGGEGGGTVCAPNGESCTTSADCCKGNCNSDGYCGSDGCLPNGGNAYSNNCCGAGDWNTALCVSCVEDGHQPTSENADDCCCGQMNPMGYCEALPECTPSGVETARYGKPCCEGLVIAIPNEYHDEMCVECVPEGEAVYNSDPEDCCDGLVLREGTICVTCLGQGEGRCSSDSDCCLGYHCNNDNFCDVKPSCIPEGGWPSMWNGIACCEGFTPELDEFGEPTGPCRRPPYCTTEGNKIDSGSTGCCTGLVADNSGTCVTCLGNGNGCISDADCCSGSCSALTCMPAPPSCLSAGESNEDYMADIPCCEGLTKVTTYGPFYRCEN